MKSYYDIIIQLELFHDYFPQEEDHICTSLRFMPTAECLRQLQEHRLIFKNTVNGFVIVGEKKNIGTDAAPILIPRVDIATGTRLHFLITETRNDFINITDTDPRLFTDGKKYVFRNTDMQQAVVSGNTATITIHNNTPLNEAVIFAPANFLGPVVIAENPVKLVLLGADREFIVEKNVPRDATGNISAERLLMNDTAFTEGIYTLQQVDATHTVTSEKKYFLSGVTSATKMNGVVQLNYNTIFLAQVTKEIHVRIHLRPRSIHWIYNVDIEKYEDAAEFLQRILPADLTLDSTVSAPAVATPFSKTIVQVSANPADWYINDKVRFRSNNPIPLHQRPYENLRLLNTTAAQPIIINNMPNPDPLQMRETLPNTYEAEMFLKVK